ncbi:hypothetical protein [Ekhidna sp.]|uniref:hypothetical protein n=1 Tax=Ekhidna sp. TaxID=2608089 RepID=UPI0032EB66CB
MQGRIFSVFFFILLLLGCSEESLPPGLYHYQIERLLSGQSGTKDWHQLVNSQNCADSAILHIELIPNASADSIDISSLVRADNCEIFDTTYIGRANASRFAERNLFSDSLIFGSGDFWIVHNVTSEQLQIEVDGSFLSYNAYN